MTKFLLVPAIFLLAACAGAPTLTSQPRIGVWDPPVDELSRPLQPGERAPAAAPRLYWKSASKVIGVDAQGGVSEFQLPILQVQEWEDVERRTSVCPTREPVWERGRCEGWDCTGSSAGGQSELWNAFYSAPKAAKAKALADAVKGVGEASAEKLVAANIFQTKPRSWEAFVQAMQKAESRRVVARDVVYQTTVKYRTENLIGLGYTAQSCKAVLYECDVFTERWVNSPCMINVPITRYNEIDRVVRTFRVDIKNPQLQPFENDQITITAGKEPTDVRVAVDGYTLYQVTQNSAQGQHTQINLVGMDRLLVDLPNAALMGATYAQRGSQPTLTVQVDPKYIPENSSKDQLVLRYTIRTCKTVLGFCSKWQFAAPVEHAITFPETVIPVTVAKGLKTEALYTIARKNSRLYKDNFIYERKTDDFKVK